MLPKNIQAALKETSVLATYILAVSILYISACLAQNISPQQTIREQIQHVFANKLIWIQNIVLAPIYEELFFRGRALSKMRLVFFPNLSKETNVNSRFYVLFTLQGAWKLVYFNALLFWFFHIPWVSLINGNLSASIGSFLLGLLCASLVVSGRSLAFVICCHAFANASGFMWFQIFEASKLGFLMQYFFQTP
jgi:membrane protease YdiL (CAAX protease family)